ncbi:MAG: DNA-binding domain-containing protein [Sphingomonas sp.]
MAKLAELQDWMQARVLDGAPGDARDHVHGDNRLTAEARLGIYAQGYRLRLLECLRTEYPVLAALAGPTAFDLFAQGYIAAHPSRSYTLYDFGADFAEYLEAARPAGDGDPQALDAVPAALARIERAKAESHRARGVEEEPGVGFDPALVALLGFDRAYRRPDSLHLLELPFDFTETLAAAERKEPPPLPAFAPSRVAVARAHYRVECHALEAWQYAWLASLPDANGACGPPSADPRVAAWLPVAISGGLVVAIR